MLVFFYGRGSDELIKAKEFILVFMKIAYLS